ncbi:MAG TPA: hypothetical protein VIK74_11500 [Parasegetibacter sp.]
MSPSLKAKQILAQIQTTVNDFASNQWKTSPDQGKSLALFVVNQLIDEHPHTIHTLWSKERREFWGKVKEIIEKYDENDQ